LTRWLTQLRNEVTDFFFPRACIRCGKVGDFICAQCSKRLPRLNPPLCPRCGKPEVSGNYCHECWGRPAEIDSIRSVFIFEGLVREAIHSFKYHNLYAMSVPLGAFMADYYMENSMMGDVIVPVPLHNKRIRERGYNQSELLSREISRLVATPVNCRFVERVKDNEPQARTKSARQRQGNVKGVFGNVSNDVNGKNIVLVDDVCTSGATLSACAMALKGAGARKVIGFTLAREI
jgi:competence protein ComFC